MAKKFQVSETTAYDHTDSSFQKFLKWSDEKEKTKDAIFSVIKNKNKSLLDIGAGNGMLTKLLENRFDHIVAVEQSKSMFEELERSLDPQKTIFINKKIQDTKIDGTFDVIIASHVFQFIAQPLELICQIQKLLKKDGLFLLIDHKPNSEYGRFYNKYRKDIFDEKDKEFTVAINYNFGELLKKIFSVKTACFSSTLLMPSVNDAISIFDFIYDIGFEKIAKDSLERTKKSMEEIYGNGPIKIKPEYDMYVCSNKPDLRKIRN